MSFRQVQLSGKRGAAIGVIALVLSVLLLSLLLSSRRPPGSSSAPERAGQTSLPPAADRASSAPRAFQLPPLVSAVALLREKSDSRDFILVDVRDAESYAKARISGSINIPLSFLRSREALRHRHLVLVSTFHWRSLLDAATSLRAAGFDRVQVLEGGIGAWLDGGGGIEGGDGRGWSALEVSATEALHEMKHAPWLVVNVGALTAQRANVFPGAIHLTFDGREDFAARLVSARRNAPQQHEYTLLVDEDGERVGVIDTYLRQAGFNRLLYLRDGWKQHEALSRQQDRDPGPQKAANDTCPTCSP